jgi:urease subunit alpha
MGEANGSLMTCEPVEQRPQFGAMGRAGDATSLQFVSPQAHENGLAEEYGLRKEVVPVANTRDLSTDDFVRNTYSPSVDVDPETFTVEVDGEGLTCDAADEVALGQRYLL